MPTPRINGSLEAIRKTTRVRYDPTRGQVIDLNLEAAARGLDGWASQLTANRVPYDLETSPHRSRLTATITAGNYGFGDIGTDHWQLLANEIQKDLKEHPLVLAMNAASPGSLALVLKAVSDFNDGTTATPAFPAGAEPSASSLFGLLSKGTTHWAMGQYVFKWTTNVSYDSDFARDEGTRELLYSTSAVISQSSPPAGIANAMTSISEPTFVDGYFWSWRRLPSTRTTTAQNRIEVSTEWWLDQWSTFIYAVA